MLAGCTSAQQQQADAIAVTVATDANAVIPLATVAGQMADPAAAPAIGAGAILLESANSRIINGGKLSTPDCSKIPEIPNSQDYSVLASSAMDLRAWFAACRPVSAK